MEKQMEELEMLEQTNETENVETETTEEIMGEGIELTDTAEVATEEKEEVKKSLKQLLKEDEEYQKQFNTMVQNRLERVERSYQKKMAGYKDVENVLRSTLNISDDAEVDTELRKYYEQEGINLPEKYNPGLSEREIEALAIMDVREIEEDGYEAMVDEANRLAKIGYNNLSKREKKVFESLANTLTRENETKALLKVGANKDLLEDKNFKEFRSKFATSTPIEFVYELYNKQSKPVYETPGSMKNVKTADKKTIFTDEDIAKMTDEELEANWEAIRKYQTQK
jgi:hypothetical protein